MSKHVTPHLTLYLDGELQEVERQVFDAHIAQCATCRAALQRERKLVALLSQVHPLYQAPESLKARVVNTLETFAAQRRRRFWMALTAAGVVLALFLVRLSLMPGANTEALPFAHTAVAVHQQYRQGRLPLEMLSDTPADISTWFAGKLSFNFKLPNYPEIPGQEKPYTIVGARVVELKAAPGAYVAYRLRHRPISLLVTSATAAQPLGGEVIAWERLRFHFEAIDGWKVLTWTDNGLTYALVSDFEERGQASCIVCHSRLQSQHMFGERWQ